MGRAKLPGGRRDRRRSVAYRPAPGKVAYQSRPSRASILWRAVLILINPEESPRKPCSFDGKMTEAHGRSIAIAVSLFLEEPLRRGAIAH